MAYEKQTWADGEEGNTPITAARLNHIEDGVADATDGVAAAGLTASGTYTGDGTDNRTISVGFTPDYVVISGVSSVGSFGGLHIMSAVCGKGSAVAVYNGNTASSSTPVSITDGFKVSDGGSTGPNESGQSYGWIAWKA